MYFFVPLQNVFLDNIILTESSAFTVCANRNAQCNNFPVLFPASRIWLRVEDKTKIIEKCTE